MFHISTRRSPVAETRKFDFRSTHEVEKVWQRILVEQYLYYKIWDVVVSNCGIWAEIKRRFCTSLTFEHENEAPNILEVFCEIIQ